jgi:WD40 repeat protein/uncharacterized protein YkwD
VAVPIIDVDGKSATDPAQAAPTAAPTQAPTTGGAAPAAGAAPSAADLRALEQQILAEINGMRANPSGLAATLTAMKQNAAGDTLTLPDNSTLTAGANHLDSAIARAQAQQPLGGLVWSDGLAQAARAYAEKNPTGRHDFNSSPESRTAVFGTPGAGGIAESIASGQPTAKNQTYTLFIDSPSLDLANRNILTDPNLTHLGVGCYAPNQQGKTTCVLDYAGNWADKTDQVAPEIGKQYALREGNGQFRYFVLSATNGPAPFPYRLHVCPNKFGWMDLSDLGNLTTVQNAATEQLVATNAPCAPADAPQGVLNNGSGLPAAAGQSASSSPAATATPPAAANAGDCGLEPGWTQCRLITSPKIKILGTPAVSAAALDAVQHIYTDMTSRFTAAFPKDKMDNYVIYLTNNEPWSELSAIAPVGTFWTGTQNGIPKGEELLGGTSQDYLWISEQMICKRGITTHADAYAAGRRTVPDGKDPRTFDQVIHEFAHAIAFRYGLDAQIDTVYAGEANPVEKFPQDVQNWFGAPVGEPARKAFIEGIFSSATEYACEDLYGPSPFAKIEVGKQYAVPGSPGTFRYYKVTKLPEKPGDPIEVTACPDQTSTGTVYSNDIKYVATAQADGLTASNTPCADVPIAEPGAPRPVATPTTTPTTAPEGSTSPMTLEVGKVYALRGSNNTFRYYMVRSASADAFGSGEWTYSIAACPNPDTAGELLLSSTSTSMADMMTVEAALAANLTADNQPCGPDAAASVYPLVITHELVNSVAWSPDGSKIVVGYTDNTARIWDAASGASLLTLTGHTDAVTGVAWSPDGQKIATGSNDNTGRIWDAASGASLFTLTGHTGDQVYNHDIHVAWSPDSSKVVTGSTDSTARIWDAATGTSLLTLTGHTTYVTSVAWSPDGSKIATASDDKTVRLWDAATGASLLTFTGHTQYVDSVTWSPDSSKVASGPGANNEKNDILIWDAATGAVLQTLTGHTDNVHGLAWSPDGRKIASASRDVTVRIWDAATGTSLSVLPPDHTGQIFTVAWSPDSSKVASGAWDKTVWIREVNTP